MNNILKFINGKKTYAGIALGAAGILCPALGAPVLVCNIVAGLGGLLALVGAQHKDTKISDALGQGAELAKQLEDLRKSIK
jgi:hypothetical protein